MLRLTEKLHMFQLTRVREQGRTLDSPLLIVLRHASAPLPLYSLKIIIKLKFLAPPFSVNLQSIWTVLGSQSVYHSPLIGRIYGLFSSML